MLAITLSTMLLFGNLAFAEEACDANTAEKKLAGIAKASFLENCERDAKAAAA